jgi:RNA polymerase sigma-70 factor, ECF subfamily
MASAALLEQARDEGWTDEQVVERVLAGETALYELLMRRHNRRVYRVARAILRDDGEAEDVMQDAYVRAYQHLSSFEGRAKFSTWLTRIAVHEALTRTRRLSRLQPLEVRDDPNGDAMTTPFLVAAVQSRKRTTKNWQRSWRRRSCLSQRNTAS